MAVDIYWHADGVTGESTDTMFAGEMELLSYNHFMEQTAAEFASTAGGATSGRVRFGKMEVEKAFDSATPILFKLCATGSHIDNIWIQLRRAGGEQLVYMEYHFTDCVITSIKHTADGRAEDTLPTELVTFNYSTMREVYHKQAREGGGMAGDVEAGWSLKENMEIA